MLIASFKMFSITPPDAPMTVANLVNSARTCSIASPPDDRMTVASLSKLASDHYIASRPTIQPASPNHLATSPLSSRPPTELPFPVIPDELAGLIPPHPPMIQPDCQVVASHNIGVRILFVPPEQTHGYLRLLHGTWFPRSNPLPSGQLTGPFTYCMAPGSLDPTLSRVVNSGVPPLIARNPPALPKRTPRRAAFRILGNTFLVRAAMPPSPADEFAALHRAGSDTVDRTIDRSTVPERCRKLEMNSGAFSPRLVQFERELSDLMTCLDGARIQEHLELAAKAPSGFMDDVHFEDPPCPLCWPTEYGASSRCRRSTREVRSRPTQVDGWLLPHSWSSPWAAQMSPSPWCGWRIGILT